MLITKFRNFMHVFCLATYIFMAFSLCCPFSQFLSRYLICQCEPRYLYRLRKRTRSQSWKLENFCRNIEYSLKFRRFYCIGWCASIWPIIKRYSRKTHHSSLEVSIIFIEISLTATIVVAAVAVAASAAFIIVIYHLALVVLVSICFDDYWIWWCCCCWARFMHEWRLHCNFLTFFSRNEYMNTEKSINGSKSNEIDHFVNKQKLEQKKVFSPIFFSFFF